MIDDPARGNLKLSDHEKSLKFKVAFKRERERERPLRQGATFLQSPKTLARYLRFLEGDERLYNHYLR